MQEPTSTLEKVKETLDMYSGLTAAMPQESVALGRVVELLSGYFDRAISARARGEPLAWVNFGVISEIFWAMDLVPVVMDVVTGLIAPSPDTTRYIDLAEQYVPDHICSNNKLLLGAMLAGEIEAPDLIVHPSAPCDSNLGTYPVMAERFGSAYFCIDMPYMRNERSRRYVAGELGRLVSFVEERTGRRLDPDRLREAMVHSNRAHELYLRLGELRRAVPCPSMSLDIIAEYALVLTLAGRPELVEYLEERYAVTRGMIDRGECFVPADEQRIRLVWIYGAPAYDMFIFLWLEQEHGAVSVASMNSNFIMGPVADISSTQAVLQGLADKIVLMPMTRECGGPWEYFIDAAIELCTRYGADAAVFAGHAACKANWAITKLVRDRIAEELSIPVMVLEVDLFDDRVVPSDALQSRFSEFFSTVLPGGGTGP